MITTEIPTHKIASHVRDSSFDVERVLFEEVHSESQSNTQQIHFSKRCNHPHNFLMLVLTPWVLLVLIMIPKEEGKLMMEMMMTMEMIERMLDNNLNVNIYWAHLLVQPISHAACKKKTMALEELVQAW